MVERDLRSILPADNAIEHAHKAVARDDFGEIRSIFENALNSIVWTRTRRPIHAPNDGVAISIDFIPHAKFFQSFLTTPTEPDQVKFRGIIPYRLIVWRRRLW